MEKLQKSVELYDPFDIDITSIETEFPYQIHLKAVARGPQGEYLEVPGFYKKDCTWSIRFAPLSLGDWEIVTVSFLPDLSGKVFSLRAIPQTNKHGVLKVDPDNPKHFIYQDGSPFFSLGYEVNWLWSVDQLSENVERTECLLDELASHGFNHLFINSYAYDTHWRNGNTTEYDFGPPLLMPWRGTHKAHDYSSLNEAYFAHFDRMMWALHERGMQAHIYMKVYNKLVNWPERRSPEEDLYFDYFVARYQAFPNVIWNFSKESYYEPDKAYIAMRLSRIRSLDAYGHMTTIHDDKCFTYDQVSQSLIDFVTDQNHWDIYHSIIYQHSLRNIPIINEEFGYEHPEGDINGGAWGWEQTPLAVLERAYEVVMAGGYPTHYYTDHAWDIVKWNEKPQCLPGYRFMSRFFTEIDWTTLVPMPLLVRQWAGRCMMNETRNEMVLYAKNGITNLITDFLPKRWKGYWMDIWTGERAVKELVLVDGGSGDIRSPFENQSSIGYFTLVE